jgi:hypothetical protein
MKKQTAVEWLIEQINQDYPEMTWAYRDECEQAKAMEKEQIIEAVENGGIMIGGLDYYTSTFGS